MPASLVRSRYTAFVRQSGCCYYCNLPMWLDDPEAFRARHSLSLELARLRQCTAEHLLARCDGGGDDPDNIVAACSFCNRTRHRCKKPLDPIRFRQRVRARVRGGRWLPEGTLRAFRVTPRTAVCGATSSADD